jgi:hypothetical protein
MFAIVPSIAAHRGDQRRDTTPYFITLSTSYADLNTANSAMRQLNKRGIKCHLDVLDKHGRGY